MKKATSRRRSQQKRRSLEPLAWAALPVIGLSVGVVASGFGIDLLVVALAALLLLTLERTVGDWMGEVLGAGRAGLIFAGAIAGCAWYFLAFSSGVAKTDSFFAAAEARGYHTVVYQPNPAPPTSQPADSSAVTGEPLSRTTSATAGGRSDVSAEPVVKTAASDQKPVSTDTASEKSREGSVIKSEELRPSEPGPVGTLGASRVVFGAARKELPAAPSSIALSLSPSQISPARRAVLRVVVTAEGRPVTEGSVDFVVNGTGAGRVRLAAGGVATTTFATYIPGKYEVRARFSGTARFQPSTSSVETLDVRQQ